MWLYSMLRNKKGGERIYQKKINLVFEANHVVLSSQYPNMDRVVSLGKQYLVSCIGPQHSALLFREMGFN